VKGMLRDIHENKNFLIFIDSQTNQSNGYMRSLSLLTRLSGDGLKRIVVWEPGRNCNKPLNLLDTELLFIRPNNVTFSNELHVVFGKVEQEEEYRHVERIVEMRIPSIIVVDRSKFIPKGWKNVGKTLESKCSFPPLHFTSEFADYTSNSGLDEYQIPETRNLVFAELNYFHSLLTGNRADALGDLFDFEEDKLSASPIWNWILKLLFLKEENRVKNFRVFSFNAMRPWIERNKDVRLTADIFTDFLRSLRYSKQKLVKLRKIKLRKTNSLVRKILKEAKGGFMGDLIVSQLEKVQCL
jgi:hypothetical protein